jgi:hypothetical protein
MVEHRSPERLEVAAEATARLPGVLTASVEWREDYDRRVIELVVAPEYERVPPRVLRRLTDHDCGVVDVSRQGTHRTVDAF